MDKLLVLNANRKTRKGSTDLKYFLVVGSARQNAEKGMISSMPRENGYVIFGCGPVERIV